MFFHVLVSIKDFALQVFKSVVDLVPGEEILRQGNSCESRCESPVDDAVFVGLKDEGEILTCSSDVRNGFISTVAGELDVSVRTVEDHRSVVIAQTSDALK